MTSTTTSTASSPLLPGRVDHSHLYPYGRRTVLEWVADPATADDKIRATLIKYLDRPACYRLKQAMADRLGLDLVALYAENYPRKAADAAKAARALGDDPHAADLEAALVALMFCANCGRPLSDPLSVERGIGPDCWDQVEPDWRRSIRTRMATPDGVVTA